MSRFLVILVSVVGCASSAPVPDAVLPPPARHLKVGPVTLPDFLDTAEGLQAAIDAKEAEVVLDIDSPGGSVGLGLAFIDMLKDARDGGMVVTCRVGPGAMAASMAAVIFEAGCDHRSMAVGGALLFHEPSVREVGGNEHALRNIADQMADMNRRIAVLISWHMGMTADQYVAWVAGRDRWLDLADAKALGAVD